MAFLRHPESESRDSSRQTFLRVPRLVVILLLRFVQPVVLVPHVPFLADFILGDPGLQLIARTGLAGGVEFAGVVVFAIVTSEKEHVAEAVVLVLVLEAATRRPATAAFLDPVRREVLQFDLDLFQASSGESYRDRGVPTVHQLVVGWSEVQVLLTPRRWRIIAGSSVVSPYSACN